MTDRDDDDGCVRGAGFVRQRLGQGPQKREGFQVDADELDSGLLAGDDVAVDEIAIGDDEQDAPGDSSLVVRFLAENVPIDHGLVDRNRQSLVGAEKDRVLELLDVVNPADLEDPDADAVVRDPEPNVLARKLGVLEERLQRICESLRVTKLAADDDPGRELLPGELHELGRPVVANLRSCQLRSADLETGDALRPLDGLRGLL